MARTNCAIFLLALVWVLVGSFALAQANSFNYHDFARLPVMHEGRVKPVGRMAQLVLQDISGVKAPIEQVAAPWLASVLFDPENADQAQIFALEELNLVHVLKLKPSPSGYYSFDQLNHAFIKQAPLVLGLRNQDAESMSADQKALLQLYARVAYYEQLKQSMTLVLPFKKGSAWIARFADLSFPLATHDQNLQFILDQGQRNEVFRVIPQAETWQALWAAFTESPVEFHKDKFLAQWSALADAYVSADAAAWEKATSSLYTDTLLRSGDGFLAFRLRTEIIYNLIQPYYYSLLLYICAFLASLYLLKNPSRFKRITSLALLGSGLALHVLGLICRMIILQRPPVSNLYESILFVGALLVFTGFCLAWRNKDSSLPATASFIAVALQLLGFAINDEAETLKVLQAVLDTKFWLATHVIIITSGYAACILTSAMAHIFLLKSLKSQHAFLQKLFQRCYSLSLISLLLISVGTLLGGVWADQSWGRFWGWDPKENGALLIALWLIWLLHGKFTKHFSARGFAIGLCLLVLVVACSWIGVNLLGVGLHSYGFINGSMTSLICLFTVEIAFILFIITKKRRHDFV